MALVYEDECVGCPKEIGCFGMACPNKRVPHHYCDECDSEEQLYHYDGEELCIDCIEKRLDRVN